MDMTSTTIQRYSLHFLLLLLLWPRLVRSQQVQQYCAFSPQHTMCRTSGIGPACGQNVPGRGVSSADAEVIVASHNSHRARVAQGLETRGASGPQPQAADMLEMIWDEELALIAQRHADQCVFEHECADCRQVERFGVGQNLYIAYESSAEPTIHWDRAVQAWYDEVDLMPNTGVASYDFNPSTGHYTQLVWGSTSLVGCGYTMFEEGGWFKKLYTCNYGPAGNMMFAAMYRTGPACSACPQGSSCSLVYPGLCATHQFPFYSTSNLLQAFTTATLTSPRFIRDAGDVHDVILLFPDPKSDVNFDIFGRTEILVDSTPLRDQEIIKESEGFFVTNSEEDDWSIEQTIIHGETLAARNWTDEAGTKKSPDNEENKIIFEFERMNREQSNFKKPVRGFLRKLSERRRKPAGWIRDKRPNFRLKSYANGNETPLERGVEPREDLRTGLSQGDHERTNPKKEQLSRFRPWLNSNEGDFDYQHQDPVSLEDMYTDDFDYSSEKKFVGQFYLDYSVHDIDYERGAKVRSSKKEMSTEESNTTVIATNASASKSNTKKSTPLLQPIRTTKNAVPKVMSTNELLKALNASDMSNVTALLIFFNNQDLFKMLKRGRSHKQTFNRLVRQLSNKTLSSMMVKTPRVQEEKDSPETNASSFTSESLRIENDNTSNADPKGSQGGQTIEENIASFEPSLQNQVAGASRSLIRSQPEVNQLAAALNQLDLSQLTIPDLLSLLAAAGAGNTQSSTDLTSPFGQLLSTVQTQTNSESLNNLQAPTNIQITSNTQTPSTTRIQTFNNVQLSSRSPQTELPPHPATVALQRQRLRNGHRRLQSPAQRGTAGQRVDGQRITAAGQTSPPSVVDSRILDVLPSAETLNKFLINVGQDSQIIKTDSLASVRDVLSTLPAGSNPLVFFRSNMGTLRQLSDRGLLAAAGAETQNQPRRIRSTKPPALQQLDDTELVDILTPLGEDHEMLLSLTAADNKEIPISPGPLSSDAVVISEERSSLKPDETGVPNSRSSLRSNASGVLEAPKYPSSEVTAVLNGPGFADPEEMLLSCQDAAAPCPVVALAGNWTHGSTEGDNVIRSILAPHEGGQLVLGQALPPPASSAACVSLSYRFVGTSDVSPQVAISVWPLGQVLLQEDLDRVSVPEGQGWQVTRVSFAPVRNAFMVVLTVEPNPADTDVEVAVRGFRVTEGLC